MSIFTWKRVVVGTTAVAVAAGSVLAYSALPSADAAAPGPLPVAGDAQGQAVAATPDAAPGQDTQPRWQFATPVGPVRMMPSPSVDPATLRFLARSDGQTFFTARNPQEPGECLVVVLSEDEGYVSCARSGEPPSKEPEIMWNDRADGTHQVSVQLPAGYTTATVNGSPVVVSRGVFGYSAGVQERTFAMEARGDGVPPLRRTEPMKVGPTPVATP